MVRSTGLSVKVDKDGHHQLCQRQPGWKAFFILGWPNY